MAKKTFTINSAGTTAGQQLDAQSVAAKLQGTLSGASVFVEASDTDGNYVNVSGGPIQQNEITSMSIPAGWYVRARVVGTDPDNSPSATLTVE